MKVILELALTVRCYPGSKTEAAIDTMFAKLLVLPLQRAWRVRRPMSWGVERSKEERQEERQRDRAIDQEERQEERQRDRAIDQEETYNLLRFSGLPLHWVNTEEESKLWINDPELKRKRNEADAKRLINDPEAAEDDNWSVMAVTDLHEPPSSMLTEDPHIARINAAMIDYMSTLKADGEHRRRRTAALGPFLMPYEAAEKAAMREWFSSRP